MTIDRWIQDGATKHPDTCAIEFLGKRLSYKDFATQIDVAVTDLAQRGIAHGDRVAWYGLNNPRVFILLFACARIGAIFVPLNWRLADDEIATIVTDCSPSTVFWDDAFAQKAQGLPIATPQGKRLEAATSDPLMIVYTSGSTGAPKGVVLAQDAIIANAAMSVQAHGLTPGDTVLNVLPLFHVGGLNILPTPAFSIGATVILHQTFDPDAMVQDLQRVQAAITVPTVLSAVLQSKIWAEADLRSLRCLSIGSTDVPADLIDAVHHRGIPLVQIYGATETAPFAIYQTHLDAMATVGSIGRRGSCDIRLVGPDGQDQNPGEIWVRGANTLLEYWNNPAQTAADIQDGWFKTGDVARVDTNGQYYFLDRIKHIIISGGENIYPAEIERILRDTPGISELSVVGMPDPKWGETPIVVAVASKPITAQAILARLNGKLARYKHPSRVVFVPALPRNAMGKVVAADVRAMLAHHDGRGA
ncbi:MAG: class I adenylate-forming enzyme family protein [Paracoccaceae bacterium]